MTLAFLYVVIPILFLTLNVMVYVPTLSLLKPPSSSIVTMPLSEGFFIKSLRLKSSPCIIVLSSNSKIGASSILAIFCFTVTFATLLTLSPLLSVKVYFILYSPAFLLSKFPFSIATLSIKLSPSSLSVAFVINDFKSNSSPTFICLSTTSKIGFVFVFASVRV